MKAIKLYIIAIISLCTTLAYSQTASKDSTKTINLREVEVGTKASLPDTILKQPRSIGIITRMDLSRNTGLYLQDAMNQMPSVQMQTRSMFGGSRIIIRGYGTDVFSSNFNGLGYKMYMNGIPITDAQGLTITDAIDYSILGKVEVVKGPSSSLFGTGIGGVVQLSTLRPEPNSTRIIQEGLYGSDGLWRTNTRVESATDKNAFLVNYGHQNYDSYRVSSKSQKDFATITGEFKSGENHITSVYLNYSHSYEQLAGEMDSLHFFQKQNWADTAYTNNNAHVEIENFRGGVSHKVLFARYFDNTTSVYFNGYNLHQAAGNNSLSSNAVQNFGGRTQFDYSQTWKKVGLDGIFGGEFQRTISYNKTYNSVDAVQGTIKGDLEIAGMQYNMFTQWTLRLPLNFRVIGGASLNFLNYDIDDYYNLAASKNQSGYKKFTPVVTPRIAVEKIFNEHITVYVDISKGYSPPTTSQMVIPYLGTANTDLKPESGMQYELGSKGSFLKSRLTYQFAIFDLMISNKLVSQAVPGAPAGTNMTVNAGKQENRGAELSLMYSLVNDDRKVLSLLRPYITYTYLNCVYHDYKSNNNNNASTVDYSGNKAVGVSPNVFNVGVDLAVKYGLYLNASFQYVDKEALNFLNSHYAPSYSLLNAKIGYQHTFGNHFGFNVYAGGNNLTNQLYYTMVFVNANPPSNPASFMPGPYKATFYGGLTLSYKF